MTEVDSASEVKIRALDELDIQDVTTIDEKIGGAYRPEEWERRISYYLRRDPDGPVAAEADGRVVGFMLGEVRSGEFGLEEPTGWIEVLGVDPDFRGGGVGKKLAKAMLAHFRELGATSVRTFVDDERDDICRFFESLGFEPASLRSFVMPLAK